MKAKKHLNLNLRIPLWWPDGSGWRRLARALVPNPGTLIILAVFLLVQSAGALPLKVPAMTSSSTTTISYQGRLADSAGNPITSSGIAMQFRMYDVDTGGVPLWEETQAAVPVEDGLFSVLLGSINPIPVSLLASNSTLWLGITVGSDSEMTPREQVASVPYAMIASTVPDNLIGGTKLATSFGESAVRLHNLILKDQRSPAVLQVANSSDVNWTTLDLTSYTSPSAIGVILLVEVWDDGGANANVAVRRYGAGALSSEIYTSAANAWSVGVLTCAMDSDQRVEYKLDATGASTLRVEIYVIGYLEPADT